MEGISVEGVAVSGHGRGSHYLSMDYYRDMIKKLSWLDPFPGTFNIRCETAPGLDSLEPMVVSGRGNLGAVLCYPAVLYLKDGSVSVSGLIVRPEKSEHSGNVLEFVTDHSIRSAYGVEDDEAVRVVVLGRRSEDRRSSK